ncbi:hypothetical protein [Flavobacterium humi]|uniref:Uncharacterized protein n=1 Tax=Flavobacterium humi TaxID=2562683 RepID=A0A4Z0LDC9_9FLAO|nr:hypothetical protein [Flavobacterium humi]TGD59890.1 hypothetical protein E4635_02870 [Flavobacterium humi]
MHLHTTILFFFSLALWPHLANAQDTIRLEKKPKAILHSWYPEHKKFPTLKVGKGEILFTTIPEFKNSSLRNNDIDLHTDNSQVQIEETDKTNQYIVTIHPTDAKYVAFEVWLDLKGKSILILQNGTWKNATELYKAKGNRILIDTVKLQLGH